MPTKHDNQSTSSQTRVIAEYWQRNRRRKEARMEKPFRTETVYPFAYRNQESTVTAPPAIK